MVATASRPRTRPAPTGRATAAATRPRGLERSVVVATFVLLVVGIICVDTAITPQAVSTTVWGFMAREIALAVVGVAGFLLVRRSSLARLARWAVPGLIGSLALLVAVAMRGASASGGQRWLGVGPLSFQPSELFTLAACFYLAIVVARTERASRNWSDVLKWSLPVVAGIALILKEPDLGTAAVVTMVALGTFVLAGMPRRLVGLVIGAVAALLGIVAVASPYQWARITSFWHGTGYQVNQSLTALGSGGWFGLGFGQSRAKWGLLPNPHTDFIFAIVGEEFGFIGALCILALFAWLLSLGVRVAARAPDRESQLLAGAVTMWFGIEVVINVASAVGWWPVTGIPLPLISYGGTSLVIDLLALGLLANVARRAGGAGAAQRPSAAAPLRPRAYPRAETRTSSRDHRRSG